MDRQSAWKIAIAAAFIAITVACEPAVSETEQPKPQAAQPVEVEIYRVEQRQQDGVLRASGLVAFKSETSLSFGASGTIESLLVDDGDHVRAGQVLATLRRTSVGADAAEAEVVRQTAQQSFDRVSRLHAAGAASQADLDAARLALERAREIVAITAPASGVILRRDAERGQVVTQGQAVLQLGETRSGVIVRAQLSSVEVARVQIGDTATITMQGREQRAGKVSQMSSKMAAGMGSFEVEVRFDQPEGLRSGEVAEVEIATKALAAEPDHTTFIIPAIALIDARADQGIVYVLGENNRVKRRAVQTEGVTDAGVVVTAGLTPGEAVVTRGASMVRDGDPVTVRQE
jgi:RND family efflux transporter MFP subunit